MQMSCVEFQNFYCLFGRILENGKTEDMDLYEEQDNARVAEQGGYHVDCRSQTPGKEGR